MPKNKKIEVKRPLKTSAAKTTLTPRTRKGRRIATLAAYNAALPAALRK